MSQQTITQATDAPGYESLGAVLRMAHDQAAFGKGKYRHAQGEPFDKQPMQKLADLYGTGFTLGQAAKKMQEAQRLPHDRAVAELLGAINYIAGTIIAMDRRQLKPHANDNAPPSIFELHGGGWTAVEPGLMPSPANGPFDYLLKGGCVLHDCAERMDSFKGVVGYRKARGINHATGSEIPGANNAPIVRCSIQCVVENQCVRASDCAYGCGAGNNA
jgi:hypothetical protein